MKRNIIITAVFVILGLIIAIGPFTIFHVCQSDGDMLMNCQKTARVELVLGIIIALFGIAYAAVKNRKLSIAISTLTALTSIAAYLVPNVIIGVCKNVHMHCRAAALPSLTVLSIILLAVAVIDTVYLIVKGKNNEQQSFDNR